MKIQPARVAGTMVVMVPLSDPRALETIRIPDTKGMMPTTRTDITFEPRIPEEIDVNGRIRI